MDKSHGQEITEVKYFTYYFAQNSDTTYQFGKLTNKIIQFINENKDFDVEVRLNNAPKGIDPWLETR